MRRRASAGARRSSLSENTDMDRGAYDARHARSCTRREVGRQKNCAELRQNCANNCAVLKYLRRVDAGADDAARPAARDGDALLKDVRRQRWCVRRRIRGGGGGAGACGEPRGEAAAERRSLNFHAAGEVGSA